METSEFAVELRKTEEKDNVMENLYVLFYIRETEGVLKILQISQQKSCAGVSF